MYWIETTFSKIYAFGLGIKQNAIKIMFCMVEVLDDIYIMNDFDH